MSELIKFPTRRLRDAGATNAEVEELHQAFARSDEVYQAAFVESFKGKDKVDVQVFLEGARRDGLVTKTATDTKDREPDAEPSKRDREKSNASVNTGNEGDPESES